MFKFSCFDKNKKIRQYNYSEKFLKNTNFNKRQGFLQNERLNLLLKCFKGNKKCENVSVFNNSVDDKKTELNENLLCNHNSVFDKAECKNEQSLADKLFSLSHYGWYWGPLSSVEADAKLKGEPDGTFLVRDSSDNHYVLTLSFRSHNQTFHTHINHIGGMFSLQCGHEFQTVEDLIIYSVQHSLIYVFSYMMRDYADMYVKLIRPASRLTEVRPLKYLCRFVIRKYVRADLIPNSVMEYIEQSHF